MIRILGLLVVGAVMSYGSSTSSVTCGIGTDVQTSASHCTVSTPNGSLTATAQTSESVGAEAKLSVFTEAFGTVFGAAAVLDTSASELVQLTSPGPVRDGFAVIEFSRVGSYFPGTTDGGVQQGSEGWQQYYSCDPGYYYGVCSTEYRVPFQLGKAFSVQLDGSFGVSAPYYLDASRIDTPYSAVTIDLFEADGVTPVSILDDGTPSSPVSTLIATPEPASCALALLATPLLLIFRRRQR